MFYSKMIESKAYIEIPDQVGFLGVQLVIRIISKYILYQILPNTSHHSYIYTHETELIQNKYLVIDHIQPKNTDSILCLLSSAGTKPEEKSGGF